MHEKEDTKIQGQMLRAAMKRVPEQHLELSLKAIYRKKVKRKRK